MPSQLEIYNYTLLALGEKPITNIKNAEDIDIIYEITVRELLIEFFQSFSVKNDELLPLGNTGKEFNIPTDFLYCLDINGNKNWYRQFGYIEEYKFITYRKIASVKMLYIKRVDEKVFSPHFAQFLSIALAKKLMLAYKVNGNIMQIINNQYDRLRNKLHTGNYLPIETFKGDRFLNY
ncbi:hypothetical protein AB832_06300 [Flavobacteriaceae bacterium (ex Bugula neritina AB1)]|nr:hypothetical protein AB832_06300 [Flavobacteriaceae bacterium (ex Bugula neritina AB1)]